MEFLQQAVHYLGMIVIGYCLKRFGILLDSDRQALSRCILYITLPAVIISSFTQVRVSLWFLCAIGLGFISNACMLGAGLFISRNMPAERKALYTINSAGYNIGNITIPFLHSTFPAGIPYICMFDIGDAMFTFGGTNAIARIQLGLPAGEKWKEFFHTLLRSPPFIVHLMMLMLSALHWGLPAFLLKFVQYAGQANGVLSMLMIGISLDFRKWTTSIRHILRILSVRLTVSFALALSVYFLLPAPLVLRQVIAIAVFSAIPNVSMVYVTRLNLDTATAGLLNTVSSILSIPVLAFAAFLLFS